MFAQNSQQEIKKLQQHYSNLYVIYQREGKSDSVLYIAQKLYPLAQRSANDTILLAAYNLLGSAYGMSGDYVSSLEYYLKFLSLAEHLKVGGGIAIAYENTSWAFYQVGNYRKGMEYGKKAVDIFLLHPEAKGSEYYIGIANALDNFALNQLMLNQEKNAEKSLLKAVQCLDKANFKDGVYYRSSVYTDLARTYIALKNDTLAEAYCLKASALNKQYKMQQISAATNNVYSDFCIKRAKF